VVEASHALDILPSEIEEWGDVGHKEIENVLRAKPLSIKAQCWSGETDKNCRPSWARKISNRSQPPGTT